MDANALLISTNYSLISSFQPTTEVRLEGGKGFTIGSGTDENVIY